MTPKEKAQQLIKFFILPEENIGVAKMTGEQVSRLARQCALIAVSKILDIYTSQGEWRKEKQIKFWKTVKEEIEIM